MYTEVFPFCAPILTLLSFGDIILSATRLEVVMDNKPYHHGNLRSTLIEAGLELISMEGEELKKVA